MRLLDNNLVGRRRGLLDGASLGHGLLDVLERDGRVGRVVRLEEGTSIQLRNSAFRHGKGSNLNAFKFPSSTPPARTIELTNKTPRHLSDYGQKLIMFE